MLTINNFLKRANLVKSINYLENKLQVKRSKVDFLISRKFIDKQQQRRSEIFFNSGKLNLELLNIFYVLVICGNINLASERLSISQPSISLSIKKLEKQSGTLLFDKLTSKKFIKLTNEGLILFNYIQRLFQILQESLDISNYKLVNFYDENLHLYTGKENNHNNELSLSLLSTNKTLFSSKIKSLNSFSFYNSIKNISEIKSINFNYLETQSKLLWLRTKTNYSSISNLCISFLNDKINFKIIEINKLNSMQSINLDCITYFRTINIIEIQTSTGFNSCLELKISNLLYWGSETSNSFSPF